MNAPEKLAPPNAVPVAHIPLDQICTSPTNPRKHFDEAYLNELAESIREHDVIQPVTLRPLPAARIPEFADRPLPLYELVIGECRLRGSRIAGKADIPAFWRDLDDLQALKLQIIENGKRKDVHALEEAESYERLNKVHKLSVEEIAASISMSKAHVYARLKLTALCPKAREACYAGKVDASTALLIARIPGETLQLKALAQLTSRPYAYRDAANYVQRDFMIDLANATFDPKDAKLVKAAGSCTACPKRTGNNPELFADIERADVCTDTKCFYDKRAARHLQLIEQATKKGVTVYRGEDAEKILPGGHRWELDDEKYVDIDDEVKDDGENRTYRQILGDKTPVTGIVDYTLHGKPEILEIADRSVIEEALKKAGWKPEQSHPPVKALGESEEQHAERVAEQAAQEADRQERQRRREATESVEALVIEAAGIHNRVPMRALALCAVLVECELNDASFLQSKGFTIDPDEDRDDEFKRAADFVFTLSDAQLAPLAIECLLDCTGMDGTANILQRIAPLLGVDASPLAPPDPTQAAQAQEQSAPEKPSPKTKAKTKAKTDPAAKTSAAPEAKNGAPVVKTTPASAWPFPTGARTDGSATMTPNAEVSR